MGKKIYCTFCQDEGTFEFQVRELSPEAEEGFRTIHTCEIHRHFLESERQVVVNLSDLNRIQAKVLEIQRFLNAS